MKLRQQIQRLYESLSPYTTLCRSPAAGARHAGDGRRGRRGSRIRRTGGAESRRAAPGRRSGHGAAPPRPAAAGTRRTRGPPTGGEDGAIAWGEELDLVIGACCPQSFTRIAADPDLASGPQIGRAHV